jgi:hypothetical protein
MPQMWECHICETGPQLAAITKKCPVCQHEPCRKCKVDNAILPPVKPKKTQVYHYVPSTLPKPPVDDQSDAKRDSLAEFIGRGPRPVKRVNKKAFLLGVRHDMRGWWKCHKCKNTNNPALCPEKCGSCEHIRCQYCTGVNQRAT